MRRSNLSFWITSAISLLSLAIFPALGNANLGSRAALGFTTSTAKWGSSISTPTGSASTSAYQIVWASGTKKDYHLISFINSGTTTINIARISFSSVKSNGDATNPPTLIFETCSSAWDLTTMICPGPTSLWGSATVGSIAVIQTLPTSQRVVIRVTNTHDSGGNFTTTLNASTSTSDIQTGVISNL